MQYKQFPHTPKRLRDARRRGDVAHSADISATLTFVAVLALLWMLSGTLIELLQGLWAQASGAGAIARPDGAVPLVLQHALMIVAGAAVVLAAAAALFAAVGSFTQVGSIAAWTRLQPQASHLNPGQGLQRLFSMRNVVNLAKLVLKALLLGALLLVVVRSQLEAAARIGHLRPDGQMSVIGSSLLAMMGWAAVIYALTAGLDWMHQRYEFLKRNRMSFEDLRREHLETEGSVLNQQRRRTEHRESVFESAGDRIRQSTLVVHSRGVAVALQYVSATELPRIMALGQGAAAEQIHAAAIAHKRYVEFNPGLAQRLLEEGALDLPAPAALRHRLKQLLARALGGDDAPKE
jgi:type III secretion protein U